MDNSKIILCVIVFLLIWNVMSNKKKLDFAYDSGSDSDLSSTGFLSDYDSELSDIDLGSDMGSDIGSDSDTDSD